MLIEIFDKLNKNNNIKSCQETQRFIKKLTNFGYDTKEAILEDLYNEINELKEELLINNKERIEQEIGDVVFVLCNLANKYNIDLNKSVKYSNKEFQRRFLYIEKKIGTEELKNLTTYDIVKLWKESKK